MEPSTGERGRGEGRGGRERGKESGRGRRDMVREIKQNIKGSIINMYIVFSASGINCLATCIIHTIYPLIILFHYCVHVHIIIVIYMDVKLVSNIICYYE